MPSKRKQKRAAEPDPSHGSLTGRKKTLRLDQALLDHARRALGVRTETDAVTQALEAVVRRDLQIQGLRALAALGLVDSKRIDD